VPEDPAREDSEATDRPKGVPEMPEVLRGPGPTIRGPHSDRKRKEDAAARSRGLGRDAGLWQQLAPMFVVGTNFAFTVLGGALLGFGVDWLAGTGPTFLLVFAGVGLLSGTWGFVRQAKAMQARQVRGRRGPSGTGSRGAGGPGA